MTDKIFYWQGIMGDTHILAKYNDVISALLSGNYAETGLDLKKMKGYRVYSVRVNKYDRLLFTTVEIAGKSHLLLLEEILNHDYQKSKFLKPGVLKNYLEKNAEAISESIRHDHFEEELPDPLNLPKPDNENKENLVYAPVEYHKKKFIILDEIQQNALQNLSAPQMLISGPPGSGKSCVSLSLLAHYVDSQIDLLNKKILYVTQSLPLVYAMQQMWQDLPQSQGLISDNVQFKTYRMIVKDYPEAAGMTFAEISNDESYDQPNKKNFYSWLPTYIRDYQILVKTIKKGKQKDNNDRITLPLVEDHFLRPENHERIYQAFRIHSFTLEEEGKKSLLFTKEQEIKWIADAYQAYLTYLRHNQLIDPAFFQLEVTPIYDLIVVDEGQDLSRQQLILLFKMAKDGKIYIALDPHQSLADAKSIRPFLLQMFPQIIHVELPASYRCRECVFPLINKIIKIKHKIAGGIADKNAYLEIRPGNQAQENSGQLVWIDNKLSPEDLASIQHMTRGADFAIVTHPQFKKEAAARFPGASLIFDITEIKGLEFKKVLAYRPLDLDAFTKVNAAFIEVETSEEKIHRAKEGKANDTLTPFLNQLITMFTRAEFCLFIYQDERHQVKQLMTALRSTTQPATSFTFSHANDNDWNSVILQLIHNGKIKSANRLIEEKLEGKPDEVIQEALKNHEQMLNLHLRESPPVIEDSPPFLPVKSRKKKKLSNTEKELLYQAASEGRLEVLQELLLKRRVNLNTLRDDSGNTLLHIATITGQVTIVKELIHRAADVFIKNNAKDTPVQAALKLLKSTKKDSAIEINIKDAVRFLLPLVKQNEINVADFYDAIKHGNIKKVALALSQNEELINQCDGGMYPLMWAVGYGHPKIAELLLEKGANPDSQSIDGSTALMYACNNCSDVMVKLLLEKGANPDLQNNEGMTALIYAARKVGNVKLMELLLQKGAKVSTASKTGITALNVTIHLIINCYSQRTVIFPQLRKSVKLLCGYGLNSRDISNSISSLQNAIEAKEQKEHLYPLTNKAIMSDLIHSLKSALSSGNHLKNAIASSHGIFQPEKQKNEPIGVNLQSDSVSVKTT